MTLSRALLSLLKTFTNRCERLTASSISNLEKIALFCAASWWVPQPTVIHTDKDTAKSAHKRLLNSRSQAKNLVIYTDESGINEKVGDAAVGPSFL